MSNCNSRSKALKEWETFQRNNDWKLSTISKRHEFSDSRNSLHKTKSLHHINTLEHQRQTLKSREKILSHKEEQKTTPDL